MKNEKFSHPAIDSDHFISGAKRGYVSIPFHVDGFWTDVITLYCQSEGYKASNLEGKWSCSISTSSGGRGKDLSDIEAYGNFAQALMVAVGLAKKLETQEMQAHLNELFKQGGIEQKQAEERTKKAREEAVAQDPALGETAAQELIEAALGRDDVVMIRAYYRASTGEKDFTFFQSGNVRKVKMDGGVVSRKFAIHKLAVMSVRSRLLVRKDGQWTPEQPAITENA